MTRVDRISAGQNRTRDGQGRGNTEDTFAPGAEAVGGVHGSGDREAGIVDGLLREQASGRSRGREHRWLRDGVRSRVVELLVDLLDLLLAVLRFSGSGSLVRI